MADATSTARIRRLFLYNGATLTDPDPAKSTDEVRKFYATTYPELTNAKVDGPKIDGNKEIYEFKKSVGTKG